MLLLTTVVVGVGMALWAAEGKDERDALVSIGAGPSVLARVVGLKAWLLALVGGVIAVPLGYGTLRLVVAAAHKQTTFPWLVAAGVVCRAAVDRRRGDGGHAHCATGASRCA